MISLAFALCLMAGAAGAQEPAAEADQGGQTGAVMEVDPDTEALVDQSAPVQQRINGIVVRGNQRVEPNTVISYLALQPGDYYDPARVDLSLKTLFATGLFADVSMTFEGGNLIVEVVENPIINRVIFEGNNALDTEKLTDEVEVEPRAVFTRARVQADVQRIIELYRRSGRFAATVTPKIVQQPQNRVDLIFEVSEGPVTHVRRINFIGNEEFSDRRLRRVLVTEESRFWRFFSSNDNYDPDRLEYDRELLRQYYADRGYADFRVVSALAELTPDQKGFYITFTVEEGVRYDFGEITVETELDQLSAEGLRAFVGIDSGDQFDGSAIESAVDSLTFAAGTSGYAFVDIRPTLNRNTEEQTVDVTFEVSEGPRVYIERIEIVGNERTLDRVIRREMQLVEGDAFNRILLDRSRNRIRALGFFEEVEIEETAGTMDDRTIVQVGVTEQPTGELSFGAGFSSVDAFLFDLQVSERNLRGRGQFLRFRISASSRRQTIDIRFTEPRFLGRNLAAGFDLFSIRTDFSDEANFESQSTGAALRVGFPVSRDASLGLRYIIRQDDVDAFFGATSSVLTSQGESLTSLFGYTLRWDKRNDPIRPTRGFDVSLSQDFAGIGGDVQYLRTEMQGTVYRGIWRQVVASLSGEAGYITGWGGDTVRINDRFFKGGNSFRGFKVAGIGPRVVQEVMNEDGTTELRSGQALGGKAYAIGSAELRFPLGLPEQYGVEGGLFSEFGVLGVLDEADKNLTGLGEDTFIEDELGFRASVGVSVFWRSPFGPVRFDFSEVLAQEEYDRTESFRFSTSTQF
ncbi:outer membrane protein assembly factor BamA [Euryhalocaulis caribicus]|uniref:outer membrane protein assembly factor BamA n=1 Tax=Euryhalocaulis caribicus TaxID=1161401 RepID=UPI0003B48099|nr:outer membrane protein assembly factor BamA [Euryhalocaulis caribicus]